MPKKECKCPPPGAPAWMATFGDMMSLLLTFFILIVSFSSIQEVEFQKALGSLRGALGVLTSHRSTMQLTDLKNFRLDYHRLAIIRPRIERFNSYIDANNLGDKIKVEEMPESIKFTLQDKILFDLGDAELKPAIFPVLQQIVQMTKDVSGVIRIEGHTDSLPIHTPAFPSNWVLSSMRAINVLHYFQNLGIPPTKLSCIGYADTRPIAPNDSAANRAKNRRVEIYLEFSPQSQPARKPDILQDAKFKLPGSEN